MKKILVIFFIVLVVATLGAVIFLVTLDVDSFRPQVISQIENVIKKPVKLDKITLGWQSGIALELRGFEILKSKKDPEAFVKVGSAKAVLELGPLLSRKIQIATIYLDQPSIRLIKKEDGTFEGFEPEEKQSDSPKGEALPKVAAAPSLLVSKIRLSDGEVFFKDAFGAEPIEVTLRKIDVMVENVSLNQPIDFKAKAAVFNNGQNLTINGKLRISSKDWVGTIHGLHGELQLAPMDFQEIAKASPAVATSGIVPPLEGTLVADIDSLVLDKQGMKNASVKISLNRGKVRLQTLVSPIENISVDVLATTAVIDVQKISANVAGGTITGTGKVLMPDPLNPKTVFDVKAEKIRVEKLVQASPRGEPQFNGLLAVTVKGMLTGSAPEQIYQTINAEGTAVVTQAVIENQNILRELFQKMSIIPGLEEKLLARLPENYQGRLRAKDTELGTLRLPFSVQDGAVQLPQINVATDSFQVTGSGTYGLVQGTLAGNAVIAIEPELSAAMVGSVKELQYLASANQEIRIPLTFQGRVPDIRVTPDLQYFASQIVTNQAQKAIGGYLQKALGGKVTPSGTGTVSGGESQSAGEGILGDLLREGLRRIGS